MNTKNTFNIYTKLPIINNGITYETVDEAAINILNSIGKELEVEDLFVLDGLKPFMREHDKGRNVFSTKMSKRSIPKEMGVYMLIWSDIVVYVGISENIKERISSHKWDKPFDKVIATRCNNINTCLEIETILIGIYNPILNKDKKGPDDTCAMSIGYAYRKCIIDNKILTGLC